MRKKSFDDFCNEVVKRVATVTEKQVSINPVTKANGASYTGLLINSEDSNITPTIALEPFYQKYVNGETIGAIVKDIIAFYESIEVPEIPETELLLNREYMTDRVIMQVINAEMNRDLLQDVPHTIWNDLAIVYRVFLGRDNDCMKDFLLHNSHLEMYDVTKEELHTFAFRNTRSILPIQVKTMAEVMEPMLRNAGCGEEYVVQLLEEINKSPMYVISNEMAIHGAVNMFYTDVLEDIAAKIGGDLFILPSSIHECLVISADGASLVETQEMVRQVNRTELRPNEVLSDNVYFFDATTKELKMM